jgi:hypothetical protein
VWQAAPAYPHRHAGAVLICGFAWTLQEDFTKARALRPDAPVIVVNGAASFTKAIALFSSHHGPKKLGVWARQQRESFGPGCTVHGSAPLARYSEFSEKYPYVDHWWPEAKGVGTSVWAARKMAEMIGFQEFILCGMPLQRGPYSNMTMARDFKHQVVRNIYRNYIRDDTQWHQGVSAMSGWTRKFFGEPK